MKIDRVKLIKLIDERHMSLSKLGKLSGVSSTALNRILQEQGSTYMTTALRLSIALNVDVDELIKAE